MGCAFNAFFFVSRISFTCETTLFSYDAALYYVPDVPDTEPNLLPLAQLSVLSPNATKIPLCVRQNG